MLKSRILKYMQNNFDEVQQTTLNPDGPGAVRIHLIPPKFEKGVLSSSITIINGRDIIPLKPLWAILLNEFMKEVNRFDGREVEQKDIDGIFDATVKSVKKVWPLYLKKDIKNDVWRMMNAFSAIAKNEIPDENIPYMQIGEYAPHMRAPHRMDIMVSAMTKDGKWHCNQKCVHCYAANQKFAEEEELSTEQWKRVLDTLRKVGVSQVTFTGGEPTMREDLFELIKYARWFVSRLNTNGIKLTKEYCQKLRESELDGIQITFYSNNEEIHNKLVGAPQYCHTVEGIHNALEVGLNVSINTPLCTLNSDYIGTLEFLHEMGVLYVTCSGLITTGNALNEGSKSLQLTKEEIEKILKDAVDYCYSHNMEINFTSPGWVSKDYCEKLSIATPNCGACLSNMAITPNGTVVPCQSWLSENALGNILADEWHSIWEHPYSKIRREYSAKMCGECPLRKK